MIKKTISEFTAGDIRSAIRVKEIARRDIDTVDKQLKELSEQRETFVDIINPGTSCFAYCKICKRVYPHIATPNIRYLRCGYPECEAEVKQVYIRDMTEAEFEYMAVQIK